ncbi:MAG: wax ester/triacylglycerol synthase domain-containing protein [Microbacteriaceae bacterium]
MHTQMICVLDGERLRRPDGRLDRERILHYLESTCGSVGFFRLRLQRSLLGLTPPAWVPDDSFDIGRHVLFSETKGNLESSQLWELSGHSDGVMSPKHPLWRLRLTELNNGDVALGLIFHHASLDGLSASKMLGAMTQKSADEPNRPPENPFASARPARRAELPLLAMRWWLSEQPSFAAGWRAYWSKPIGRRIRRVAARTLRPIRNLALRSERVRAQQLPPRHSDFRTMNSRTVTQRASDLGGTISDLLVATVIRAYDGEEHNVSLRFPVSQRSATGEKARNQVQDMELYGCSDDPLNEILHSVRSQIANRPSNAFANADVPGRQIGYATLIPWVSRARFFCGAELTEVVPFPASLGRDELSAAAILYNGMLSATATMPASRDVESVASRIGSLMTGGADVAAH